MPSRNRSLRKHLLTDGRRKSNIGGMNHLPLLLIFFLVSFVLSLVKSKARIKTTLYAFGMMALIVGLGFALSRIFPRGYAGPIGTITAPILIITGMLTAIIHSRKSVA